MSNLFQNIITSVAKSFSISSTKKVKSITSSSSVGLRDQTENLKQETQLKSKSSDTCPTLKCAPTSRRHDSTDIMLTSMDFLGNKFTETSCVKCKNKFRRMSIDNGRICPPCDIERQLDGTQ